MISMYSLQILVATYVTAKRESRVLEEEFHLGIAEDCREALAAGLGRHASLAESNVLLGCLPLDLTIAAYAVAASVVSLYKLIELLQTSHSSGGWALLLHASDQPTATFWFEAVGYVTTLVVGACAAGAILAQWRLDRKVVDYQEDLVLQLPARERCAGLLLLFFIVSALRFAMWVPVSGMALASRDICGLYLQGLAATSLSPSASHAIGASRCSASEWMVLGSAVSFLALDAYVLSATHQLWRRCRMVCIASRERAKESPLFGVPASTFAVCS
eukprot:SRR837773.9216.p1 GENE.SRR837773.9216~~SRR837773.9216.p1  ORF type:complete len:274 (-),score=8.70 SRR837773.9216:33-854(-)